MLYQEAVDAKLHLNSAYVSKSPSLGHTQCSPMDLGFAQNISVIPKLFHSFSVWLGLAHAFVAF